MKTSSLRADHAATAGIYPPPRLALPICVAPDAARSAQLPAGDRRVYTYLYPRGHATHLQW